MVYLMFLVIRLSPKAVSTTNNEPPQQLLPNARHRVCKPSTLRTSSPLLPPQTHHDPHNRLAEIQRDVIVKLKAKHSTFLATHESNWGIWATHRLGDGNAHVDVRVNEPPPAYLMVHFRSVPVASEVLNQLNIQANVIGVNASRCMIVQMEQVLAGMERTKTSLDYDIVRQKAAIHDAKTMITVMQDQGTALNPTETEGSWTYFSRVGVLDDHDHDEA
ncbi:hypothetical protein BCR33DRAFT_733634 [Rhizoclosmatium globosum]|uniref:Uncharacterized protein n=1 Tax=Rhizoclosmatium globosum TaxID=329046 RepID=A0A1Y2CW54_9FUNG|nr:hypothetical protein BCR33DRAFT_733634 [Rhizoclosmatium globosum]|eukprot:ORY51260.1 hypothetical protein BCR33DRAFT_733634 [Rhizoclosmatium globosum]